MTLQQSGQISALDIIVEEAIHPQDSLGMNTTLSRNLAKRSSGQIAYSDFYGKSSVVPGCQGFSTSTSFQIPAFNNVLTIEVWGAGASGGNSNSNLGPAAAGGYSVAKLNGGWLVGYGGQGGQNQLSWTGHRGHYDGYGGVGGAASGGDINMSGGDGAAGQPAAPGRGGTAVRGGAGGAGQYPVGQNGGFPGGGGGGTGEGSGGGKFSWDCGGGGAGGYVAKNIFKGDGYAPPYSTAIIEIGAPGLGVAVYGTEKGGDGAAGYCRICWDMGAVAPLQAGTYINSFCYLYGLYYTLADGNNGTYIQLAQSNSPACGYVAPPDGSTSYTEPGTCFLPGSKVRMADGTDKNIEDVKIGEYVLGAFGEFNQVIAKDDPWLGNRFMYKINGEHDTSDDHPHVSPDKKFYCPEPDAIYKEWGSYFTCELPDGTFEQWLNVGLKNHKVELLTPGVVLQTLDGGREVKEIIPYNMPYDTKLYNLVVAGSHTYFVNEYAVTGWPREDDFDYDTWKPTGVVLTYDDYRNPKV